MLRKLWYDLYNTTSHIIMQISTKTLAGVVIISLVTGAITALVVNGHYKAPAPLATSDSNIAKHAVVETVPLQALDKPTLHQKKIISSGIAQDNSKEVLATGEIRAGADDSKENIAAILDKKTGATTLVGSRPLMEWLAANKLAVGYGIMDAELTRAISYQRTFMRVGSFFAAADATLYQRPAENDWATMLWISYKW